MPFETFATIALAALAGVGAVALFLALRRSRSVQTARNLDDGHFEEVLESARSEADLDRDDLLAAAFAAKHLLDFDGARKLLARILQDDGRDGEAWLELGLVESYDGRYDGAERAFGHVAQSRSDLLESLTLHRAWLADRRGDATRADRLFAEVEVPLETKLRTDLGEGDPAFAEWFLQTGLMWRRRGDEERSAWALAAARRAAPESRLIERLAR